MSVTPAQRAFESFVARIEEYVLNDDVSYTGQPVDDPDAPQAEQPARNPLTTAELEALAAELDHQLTVGLPDEVQKANFRREVADFLEVAARGEHKGFAGYGGNQDMSLDRALEPVANHIGVSLRR